MDIIRKYFPHLEPLQAGQLTHFREEILKWNLRLNLVSRKDTPHLEERHILHSLGIAAFPLAILYPQAHFILIDSIGKKINAVREIIASLGLSNVDVRQVRAEMLEGTYHFVVSRAVTNLSRFTEWVKGHILYPTADFPSNGILCLKGGDLKEELRPFPDARIYSLEERFSEPFFKTKKLIYLSFEGLKKNITFAV